MSYCSEDIAIIGGGQLGKLLIDKTSLSTGNFFVYSPEKPLISGHNIRWTKGSLTDSDKIYRFVNHSRPRCVTIEIENVSVDGLRRAEKDLKIPVYPSPDIIEMIKNKKRQKEWLITNGFPTAELLLSYESHKEIEIDKLNTLLAGRTCMNKLQVGGYDGYGVKQLYPEFGLEEQLFPEPSLIEEKIDVLQELSIIVGRNPRGQTCVLPISEMVFNKRHMLDYLICPAKIGSPDWEKQDYQLEIEELARQLAEKMELVGILAIELFLDKQGKIWINEMAPRPHNSGHHTVDTCTLNQYDLLIACLLNNNLPERSEVYTEITEKGLHVLLINILGPSGRNFYQPELIVKNDLMSKFSTGSIEWYGKTESRPSRKMGHMTVLVDWEQSDGVSQLIREHLKIIPPQVGVIMGSSSDLSVVKHAIEILENFGINHEVKVVSAHRTPQQMLDYASSASERGLQVIIAAAGGAAHLPGMVASATTLPVIGIPVKSSNSIDGWDSLLSICQMPGGIPVATMAVNGALNAGLMAIRMLALSSIGRDWQRLDQRLEEYQESLQTKVELQNQELIY